MDITNEQYLILNAVFYGYVRGILDAHLSKYLQTLFSIRRLSVI